MYACIGEMKRFIPSSHQAAPAVAMVCWSGHWWIHDIVHTLSRSTAPVLPASRQWHWVHWSNPYQRCNASSCRTTLIAVPIEPALCTIADGRFWPRSRNTNYLAVYQHPLSPLRSIIVRSPCPLSMTPCVLHLSLHPFLPEAESKFFIFPNSNYSISCIACGNHGPSPAESNTRSYRTPNTCLVNSQALRNVRCASNLVVSGVTDMGAECAVVDSIGLCAHMIVVRKYLLRYR